MLSDRAKDALDGIRQNIEAIDAGNVYRHTYSKVSASIVWDTAVRQLDDLKAIIKQELPASRPPEPDTSREHAIDESTKE